MDDRCHYVKHGGKRILIPGCWSRTVNEAAPCTRQKKRRSHVVVDESYLDLEVRINAQLDNTLGFVRSELQSMADAKRPPIEPLKIVKFIDDMRAVALKMRVDFAKKEREAS